jgi:hypothetical protein
MNIWYFYEHLVFLRPFDTYILWPFDTFYGHLVYFYLQEKSGNPVLGGIFYLAYPVELVSPKIYWTGGAAGGKCRKITRPMETRFVASPILGDV